MSDERKTKLVCNLGMDDFFTLPDSNEVWRKKGGDFIYVTDASGDRVKRYKAYECESLHDRNQKITLPGNQRVDLVDK
jgi:hypothetical protein